MALTELSIKKCKPKEKLYRVADSGGLCLEVTPAGGKFWRWRYVYEGKAQMLALGKFPQVPLLEARRLRDEAKATKDGGKHPSRARKALKLKVMNDGQNTFEKVARRWLEEKGARLNLKYHKQCLLRMEQHVFPQIGALPITEITIPDVVRVIDKIAARGTIETAKRMGQLIGQTFRFASRRGLCAHNPAADLRDITPAVQERHHPCIAPEELPALLRAIEGYQGSPLTISAIKLIAMTFVRTQELIGARWDEIDWAREEWRIPVERMKMKRPHMVPLSSQALSVLTDLKAITGDKDFIFFSSRSRKRHISNGSILMALRRMGYQRRMTGHGFRTLASTLLNEAGFLPDVIERQLAHEDDDKIRAAYNRAEYFLERKKMMQEYSNLLQRMGRHPEGENIIHIEMGRRR